MIAVRQTRRTLKEFKNTLRTNDMFPCIRPLLEVCGEPISLTYSIFHTGLMDIDLIRRNDRNIEIDQFLNVSAGFIRAAYTDRIPVESSARINTNAPDARKIIGPGSI